MNSIRITTTQNIEIEYELANVGERILAWLIDIGIFLAYFFLLGIVGAFQLAEAISGVEVLVILLLASPYIFYNLACDIFLNGQTIGKRVMKIKVISLNGEQPTIGQYILRWLFRIVDIYFFYALPAFIAVIVSDKKQRIGDMIAGTTVIRTQPRTNFQQTLYTPTPDLNYTVSFPEVVNLTDKDMQLIKEVILNTNKSGNTVMAYHAAERIKQTLNVQTTLEPQYFLQVLLADYNHLTAKM